jgi:hypothetical protein
MPAMHNFVLFKTDLFLSRQRDEDIDRWAVGGDCAGWFYVRLLMCEDIRPGGEPVMEDWGWTFVVTVKSVRVRLNVWPFNEMEPCWLIGLEPKDRLFRWEPSESLTHAKDVVADALERWISNDPRIERHEWFAGNPFDLMVKEFSPNR